MTSVPTSPGPGPVAGPEPGLEPNPQLDSEPDTELDSQPGAGVLVDPAPELIADVFARDCPSRRTMENVAGKWGILALVALAEGSYRFNALRRRVDGVSEKMLAQTLHALERDGLIGRQVQTTIPPHVEYRLTEFGGQVAERLAALIDLVEGRLPQILAAQARYDADRAGRGSPSRGNTRR